MITEILESLKRAHQTIRSNPVLVWFPPLFSLTLAVLLVLCFVVLLQLLPDFGSAGLRSGTLPTGSLLLLVVIGGVAAVAAVNAGTMHQQSLAVKGEAVDTGHFLSGAQRLFWRILAGSLLGYLWYGALTLALGWPIFVDLVQAGTIGGTVTVLSNAQIEAIVRLHAGRLVWGGLLVLQSAVLLSMWPRALASGELSLWPALRLGLAFAFRRFFAIGGVLFLLWGGNLLISIIFGEALWPITAVASHIAGVYVSVGLMHYYDHGGIA